MYEIMCKTHFLNENLRALKVFLSALVSHRRTAKIEYWCLPVLRLCSLALPMNDMAIHCNKCKVWMAKNVWESEHYSSLDLDS